MNLALYGGSFDPPHAGHVSVVKCALEALPIDKLVIVPASRNPFKPSVRADGAERYRWLTDIFGSFERTEISDFEIRQNRSVATIETVRHFIPMCDKLYVIIGADNLDQLKRWHRYEELDTLVEWVVATRNDIPVPDNMIRLDVNEPISSTDFRMNMGSLGLDPVIEKKIITYYKGIHESKN